MAYVTRKEDFKIQTPQLWRDLVFMAQCQYVTQQYTADIIHMTVIQYQVLTCWLKVKTKVNRFI